MNPPTPQPITLTQGNTFYSPQTGQAQGTVNFNAQTGQQLAQGATTTIPPITNPGTQPTINPGVVGTQPLTVPTPVINNTANANLQTTLDKTFTGTQTQGKDGSVVTTYADGTTNAPITPDGQRQSFADQLKGVFTQLGTKGAETARIQDEEGVQAKKDAVRNIENQALSLDNSFKKQQDALLGNGAMTREQAAPQVAELQRMYNSQKADLAIQHQVAQGDYQSAFEIAQAKVDAEFAPLQTQLDSLNAQINLFQNDMTDSEKEKAQEAYQTQKDALDFEKQKELAALSHKYNLSEIYARSTGDGSTLSTAPTTSDYTIKAGDDPYNIAQDNGTDVATLQQLNPQIKDWHNIQPGTILKLPTSAGLNQAALSTILGSGKFTKDQVALVTNAIKNGQDPLTVIKNQAKNIMGQTEATKLTSYESARDTLVDLGKNLEAFYAAGGDTGIFTGNFEQAINKLGKVNNPALVDLATQIQGNIQVYRNAISGTAYSNQEGKSINSIFPGINKSQTLNNAIQSGRAKLFDSTIDSIYRSALGSTYDQLVKKPASANTSSSGDPAFTKWLKDNGLL